MTNTEPNVAKTGAYSIRETCEALAINRSTLRKYTDLGYITPRYRRVGSRIFYTGIEILRFWRVEVNGAGARRYAKGVN